MRQKVEASDMKVRDAGEQFGSERQAIAEGNIAAASAMQELTIAVWADENDGLCCGFVRHLNAGSVDGASAEFLSDGLGSLIPAEYRSNPRWYPEYSEGAGRVCCASSDARLYCVHNRRGSPLQSVVRPHQRVQHQSTGTDDAALRSRTRSAHASCSLLRDALILSRKLETTATAE
jgi:hypothetical protein